MTPTGNIPAVANAATTAAMIAARKIANMVRVAAVERAVNKAERMGLHRVRVVDVGRHSITVRGRSYGERARLTFGRAPSCPVIG